MTGSSPSSSMLRDAMSSLIQVVLSAIAIFLLYRVVLEALGTREFGIWALVLAATSMVGLSNMGLTNSIIKHVAERHSDGDLAHVAALIETSVISVAALAAVLACAGYPLMRSYFAYSLDADAYQTALSILPMALLAFVLSMVTGIYHSALYGCHLIVARNSILIFDSLGYLGLAVWLAPAHGLKGLIDARVLQNALTLFISVSVLRRHVPDLPLVLLRWSAARFKELIGYAFSLQLVGLLNLAMDPVTKGLLSRFGSLEMVTYYEMSSRLILQVRGLIVSANQVLLPTFAKESRGDAIGVSSLFERSFGVTFYVTVCFFSLSMAAMPLLGLIWLGREQILFVDFSLILCVGWMVNTLAVPAYFACLGTGTLRVVVFSHLIMSVLNVLLSYGLGRWWGGIGVVAGWSMALASGGLATHVLYCWPTDGRSRMRLPPQGLRLILLGSIGLLLGYAARVWTQQGYFALSGEPGRLLPSSATLICFLSVFLIPAYLHPVRGQLMERLLPSRRLTPRCSP